MQKRRGEERQAEEKGRGRKAEEKGTGRAVRTEESNFWHLTSFAVANSTNPMPRDFPLSLSVGKRIESGEKPESCAEGASSKWDKTCSNTDPSYNDGKRVEGREGTELSYGVRRPEGMEGGNRKGERGGREGRKERRVGREGGRGGREGRRREGERKGKRREEGFLEQLAESGVVHVEGEVAKEDACLSGIESLLLGEQSEESIRVGRVPLELRDLVGEGRALCLRSRCRERRGRGGKS